jgi:hypothetical protein
MLPATCHCGAVEVRIPEPPDELTNCNCSICRRLGALWAYYPVEVVEIRGHPASTEVYVQGDRTLRVVRCRNCGCTTHWEPLVPGAGGRMGINIRNFDPELIGPVRIRLLDGADTWTSTFWDERT